MFSGARRCGSTPTRPLVRTSIPRRLLPPPSTVAHRSRPCAATCPKCDHGRAYFYQLQIRSADEPMTTCASLSAVSSADIVYLSVLVAISFAV